MSKKIKYNLSLGTLLMAVFIVLQLVTFPGFAAQSSSTETDIELTPGPLLITQVPSFSFRAELKEQVRYDTIVTGSTAGKFTIEDGRGTQQGWTLSVSLSRFVMDRRDYPPYKTLAKAELHLGAPTISPNEAVGNSFTGYPAILTAGDGIYHKIVSAPPGTSGGSWDGTFSEATLWVSRDTALEGMQKAQMLWKIEDAP